jgi:Tol biopolymer transport system component
MLETSPTTPHVDPNRVLDAMSRVLCSKWFQGSPRLSEFLRYAVLHSLRGELSDLKEVCIGITVFGKDPTYDPKQEPIVRVEARRLRARLTDYYAEEGRHDSVHIRLPKGGYIAFFEENPGPLPEPMPVSVEVLPGASANSGFQSATASVLTQPSAASPSRRFRRLFLVGAVIALATAATAVFIARFSAFEPLRFNRIAPLAAYAGTELQPAISHDGKQVAFVWGGEKDDNFDIYVKLLDVGTPVRLTTNPAQDLAPQWSPDDRFIAFERVSEQGIAIYIVPALGGSERRVADLHMPFKVWKAEETQNLAGSGPVWSADGRELIVSDQESPVADTTSLYAIPLDGSSRRRLTRPSVPMRDFNGVVSHDGKHIAFLRESSNSAGDLFVSAGDGSNPRQITFDYRRIRGIAWAPNDRSLVFASNRGGADGLWQVSVHGGAPIELAAKGDEISFPSLSVDGFALAYTATKVNSNIWRLPLLASKNLSRPVPKLLIASEGRNDSPRYSPDGRKIAFVSDRSGAWEIWICDSEGNNLRQITSFGGPMVGTPHWSSDSSSIVFDTRPNGRSLIYAVTLDDGNPTVVIDDGFEDKKPNWSRNGRSIYYTSNRNGGFQLWRSGLHGERPIQLTQIECNDSFESADGKWIYFQNDGYGIYRLPIQGGKAELISTLKDVDPSRYLDVSDHVYFLDRESTSRRIREFDPSTDTVTTIGTIDGQVVYGTPSLSVSPDRSFILFAQQDKSSSEIMMLRR